MRRDVFAADLLGVVVLLVDLDFIAELRDVRDIDLHRAVAQRFHELVVLELAIFGLVRMADDHFVDVGLREFLRFDLVFLAGAEQVVKERDLELQDFDEFDDAAVGDVEFAVEIEGARIGVRAVDGDLAIVDVARQFGGILVLFVFRLEGADADAVFLGKHQPAHLHMIHDLEPVAFVAARQFAVHLAAGGAEIAFDLDLELRIGAVAHQFLDQLAALVGRNQVQRFFAHRARQFVVDHCEHFFLDIICDVRSM